MGAANDLRNTRRLILRNGEDCEVLPAKSTCRSETRGVFSHRADKVLNLRMESKREATVTIRAVAQNKFIIRLRLITAEKRFQSARCRYADK